MQHRLVIRLIVCIDLSLFAELLKELGMKD